MKTTAILTATLGLMLGSLHAQTVPPFINYQGTVTDSAGIGLGTGTPVNRKVIFRIFDAATGGNRLWSEQHTVTISNGEFSVLLGNGINANYAGADETPLKTATPLDTVFTSTGIVRYVEIVVDNGDNTLNAGDAPIAPRQQITSTAYSFRARSADTIASGTDLQLNGSDNYGLGYYGATRLFNGAAIDGPVLFGQAGGALGSVNGGTKNIALRWNAAGAVGIGSADLTGAAAATKLVLQGDDSSLAPQQLNIRGNTDTNKRLLLGYNTTSNYGSLQAYSAASTATNLLLNPSGGNVGIGGTAMPLSLLHLSSANINGAGVTFTSGGVSSGITQKSSSASDRALQFHNQTASGGNQSFSFLNNNATNLMTILADGNVGIGTTSPSQKLSVNGNANFTGNVGIGTSSPTSAKLVISGSAGAEGLDLSTTDQYANLRVLRNSRNSGDKDMYIGLGSGTTSSLHLYSNNTETITVKGTNVGIGTTNPTRSLTIEAQGTTPVVRLQDVTQYTNYWWDIRADAGHLDLAAGGGGTGRFHWGTGAYTNASDGSLKKNIEPLSASLDRLLQLEPVSYVFKTQEDDAPVSFGFIAQDVQPLFPEVVETMPGGKLGLTYSEFIPITVAALQELKSEKDAEVKALQEENIALRASLAAQEKRLASIEQRLAADSPATCTVSLKQGE